MSFYFKIAAWAAVLAIVFLVVAYVFELPLFDNCFGIERLLLAALATGGIIGTALAIGLRKKLADSFPSHQLWATCLIIPCLFMPLLFSWANRSFSFHPIEQRSFVFFDEKPYAKAVYGQIKGETLVPDGYFIFVQQGAGLKRLRSRQPRFGNQPSGTEVLLPIRHGLLGFDVVAWDQGN